MTVYTANPGDAIGTLTAALVAGDTLQLNDGQYNCTSDANRLLVRGINGTSGNHITIKSINDGKVILDGTGSVIPLMVSNCSNIDISGLRAQNSSGNVVWVFTQSGAGNGAVSNVTLKRITASGAASGDFHPFQVYGDIAATATQVTFEDCASWGYGRYGFNVYHADHVTLRRCYNHWYGIIDLSQTGPRAPVSIYGSHNCLVENFIGVGAVPYFPDIPMYYTSSYQTSDDTTNYPCDNNVYKGCVFYNGYTGFYLNNTGGNNTAFANCYFESNTTQMSSFTDRPFGSAFNWNGNANAATFTNCTFANGVRGFNWGQTGLGSGSVGTPTLTNCIFYNNSSKAMDVATVAPSHTYCDFNGNGALGFSSLDSTDVTSSPGFATSTYGKGGSLFIPASSALHGAGNGGADIGASILYQYQNGSITATPLWPWPMESRVMAELGISPTWLAYGGLWQTLGGLFGSSSSYGRF